MCKNARERAFLRKRGKMNRILLIGSGWRARMWARVISALPDVSLAGVLCRNPEKRAPFEKIGVPVCGSYDEALITLFRKEARNSQIILFSDADKDGVRTN